MNLVSSRGRTHGSALQQEGTRDCRDPSRGNGAGPASWICNQRALRGCVLKRALSMVEVSAIATVKFLIMLSLNLSFVNEV